MTKHECRNKHEARTTKSDATTADDSIIRHSFGLRHSDFEFLLRDRRSLVHGSSSSNSSSRCSNNRNVLSIGADVVMSTPAAFKVSSGNFEPPDRRKSRYSSTPPDSWASTRRESATAA